MGWLSVIVIGGLMTGIISYFRHRHKQLPNQFNLTRNYLVGLNYLLNEEPDKAVDVFIKMLEVDSQTVETHFAVGKLFRRRGEVDRAIRIHQNLIARPQLDKTYRDQSLFELGQDYLSAGVLDRAERVFLDLTTAKTYTVPALRALLDIYQQEKAWEKAIQIAHQLQTVTRQESGKLIAQYHCELAQAAIAKHQYPMALTYLNHALQHDPCCVRASLLESTIFQVRADYRPAITSLLRVEKQNPDYLSEIVEPLASCYEALQEDEACMHYLIHIMQTYPKVPVILILFDRFCHWQGYSETLYRVGEYMRSNPSLKGLHIYLMICLLQKEDALQESLQLLRDVTGELLVDAPEYQCKSCGFEGKILHWHCPGCKQWNTMKPIL